MTAADIARLLGVEVDVDSGASRRVTHAAAIGEADDGSVSFLTSGGAATEKLLGKTRASVVIVGDDVAGIAAGRMGCASSGATLLAVINPRLGFIRVLRRFFVAPMPSGVHPTAFVDPSARLGDDVYVGPLATVGAEVTIGARSLIHSGAHIYERCAIGRDVTVHSGAVIGADGFGYERDENGVPMRFPHLGDVIVEDHVEIGANACIDRGTLGTTLVRMGAKIDNLVHIAHNVEVGRGAFVIALSMVGGGALIGDGSWVAPSACVKDHVEVGARATIGMGSVVLSDVESGATVAGVPARILRRDLGSSPEGAGAPR